MQNMFQSFRSGNRNKLKQEKKNKLNCIILCIVYNTKQLSFN